MYSAALVPSRDVGHRVVLGDDVIDLPPVEPPAAWPRVPAPGSRWALLQGPDARRPARYDLRGVRKTGGNANVGVWVRTEEAYRWLAPFLTAERLQALMPEARSLEVQRHDLPNIRRSTSS